jgi:hypothetical protein
MKCRAEMGASDSTHEPNFIGSEDKTIAEDS